MNAEHQALAEYLEAHIDKRFNETRSEFKEEFETVYKRFDRVDHDFKEVHRRINSQIEFVDRKNEDQDEFLEDHELRIGNLESDYQVLTSQT